MNQKNLFNVAVVIVMVLLGMWTGVSILMNPTGGIAGLSKLVTVVCVVISIIKPKTGLFVLAAQAIYVDQLKRVGVYYGAISMQTVQEILIGPLLTLCALNAGFLIHLAFGRVKMPLYGWALYSIGTALGLYFLAGGAIGGGDSFTKRVYNAGTASAYTTVIPLAYALFPEVRDWVKFLSFQVLLVVPSAGWAIWQYFNGFSDMEWAYARSGLSKVHTSQMLFFIEPRVFGFFGSASALGCLCIYFTFSVWRTLAIPKRRFAFAFFSLVIFVALVCSTQRSALLSPFIFGVFIFCFRTRLKTIALYGALAVTFILGVVNSTWLLDEGLDKINDAISNDGKWSSQVLKVSTFSDRLRGWERLKRRDSWSLLGTGEELRSQTVGMSENSEDFSHDMINRVLMKVGALGLFAIVAFGGAIAYTLHKVVWNLPKGHQRWTGAISLGIGVPICLMSVSGGDNFTATPYNLAIWSAFAGIFVIRKINKQTAYLTTLPQSAPEETAPNQTGQEFLEPN